MILSVHQVPDFSQDGGECPNIKYKNFEGGTKITQLLLSLGRTSENKAFPSFTALISEILTTMLRSTIDNILFNPDIFQNLVM